MAGYTPTHAIARVPEPYEDVFQQGPSGSAPAGSSTDALNEFYAAMERRQSERKLSKNKSIWSRKKSADTAPVQNGPVQTVPSALDALPAPDSNPSMTSLQQEEPVVQLSQSIIPDVTHENPALEAKDIAWAASSALAFRAKHPIHNPMGPRHYKNHHIIPPHAKREVRVPSVFSPSFPPMAPSIHTRSQDSSWAPGPSHSPSGSPVHTPNSSQTRINDPSTKSRSRKNSQTHDNVDLLDGTDPWGQAWHHQSPYDIGKGRPSVEGRDSPTSPISPVSPPQINNPRSRRASATTTRQKKVAPSPLSQSTSAVHLSSLQTDEVPIMHHPTKRRKHFRGLFGSSDLTLSPTDHLQVPSDGKVVRKLSKRSSASVATYPNFNSLQPGDRKEKRGSILGRIARRFSVARRSDAEKRATQSFNEDWHHVDHPEPEVNVAQVRPSSPEKLRHSRRVPPPEPEQEPPGLAREVPPMLSALEPGDRSSLDLETPITLGRLTIMNPDDPSSTTTTPATPNVPLPRLAHSPLAADSRVRESSSLRPEDLPPPVPSKSNTPFVPTVPLAAPAPAEEPAPEPQPEPQMRMPEPQLQMPEPDIRMAASPEPLPFSPSPEPNVDSPTSTLAALAAPTLHYANAVEESPLARASLYVNPPTPQVNLSNGIADLRSAPGLSTVPEGSEGPKIRTSSSGKVRETETFRLVRSPSENIYSQGQTLMANGQQWEVIDSNVPKRSASSNIAPPATKERAKESDSRETRRREKERSHDKERSYDKERSHDRERSRDRERLHEKERSYDKEKHRRETSYHDGGERRYSRDHERETRRHEKERSKSWYQQESSDKRENRRPEKSKRESYSRQERDSHSRQERESIDRYRPAVSQPTPSSSSSSVPTRGSSNGDTARNSKSTSKQSLEISRPTSKPAPRKAEPEVRTSVPERRPSTSTRPISEVPSTAELNNMRAKEAWEMDRMWKGRSMSGQESHLIASPASVGNELDQRVVQEDLHRSNTHGSSHTYFVVQTPFQGPPTAMPVSPPPILYTHQSAPSLAFPSVSASSPYPRSPNPPPEPIRTAPIQLAPLPPSLASLDDPSSREYWAKLAGVPARN